MEDISTYIKGDFASYFGADESSAFEFWLRTDIPRDNYLSSSRLLGKDVILPYAEPDRRRTGFATGDRGRKFASIFVVGRDEQGGEIEATCNEDELSNYFTDRGTPHFLTPVFFSREVLAKYYQEPSRYQVRDSSLRCLNLWILPIDITEEGLIQVWLGDLGRIPYKEQLHWRQFNVPPQRNYHRGIAGFVILWRSLLTPPMTQFTISMWLLNKYRRKLKRNLVTSSFQGLDKKIGTPMKLCICR